ncbi:MAG: cytochrome c3 family protein [Candidatus Sumerlaeota bacterium]|nr:cytochrome c3 family protein [Candidatus Sumerlaeota bacterium]
MSRNDAAFRVPLLAALLAGWNIAAGSQSPPPPPAQILGPDQCAPCHAAQTDDRLSSPTRWLAYDRHALAGLGCADCHGGDPRTADPQQAHGASAGFVGRPDPLQIPDLCARCHSSPQFMITYNPSLGVDQYEKYWTSRHGQLLKMGMRKVAQCASCHTAHNIRGASDPSSTVYRVNVPRTCAHCHGDPVYMAGYPIPTDQYVKYAASVHGQALLQHEDLAAPACNNCHGNHGAVPPGADSLAHVCGLCHAMNAQLFEKSPHAKPFATQGLPQCVVCHRHHAIAKPTPEIFDMGADSVCIACHRQNDAGWQTGKKMYALISGLSGLNEQAERALDQAQTLGMDVSDGRFALMDFRKSFLELRTLSHSFDLSVFSAKAEEAKGQAAQPLQTAKDALREFHFRRQGLLVSLLLSLPVLALLYWKIRHLPPRG